MKPAFNACKYKFILRIQLFDEKRYDNETRLLIEKIEAAPQFSAMDFFEVNKSTISTIIGIVATYSVVLLQSATCADIYLGNKTNGSESNSNI